MKRTVLIASIAVIAVGACQKADNPLVTASDGQFARLIEPKSALSPSCAAALYEPELYVQQYNALKFSPDARISGVSEQQRGACTEELQKRASEIGIAGNITAEHVRDDRVRQRYLAARKK